MRPRRPTANLSQPSTAHAHIVLSSDEIAEWDEDLEARVRPKVLASDHRSMLARARAHLIPVSNGPRQRTSR